MLRRTKRDVKLSIPDNEEQLVPIELTSGQKVMYRALLMKNYSALRRRARNNGSGPSLNNTLMKARRKSGSGRAGPLRKVCNHPALMQEDFSPAALEALSDDDLVRSSGKMALLDMMLTQLKASLAGGHRVLVFSQFVTMLDVLVEYARRKGWSFCRIDGSVGIRARQAHIDRFNNSAADSHSCPEDRRGRNAAAAVSAALTATAAAVAAAAATASSALTPVAALPPSPEVHGHFLCSREQ
ncbi:unnamed protein product [Phaeothamnion confervicola]